ncbi:MAG: methionine gamma-lyase family protein [Thermoanaerobacteraceae bacterium]|nr:methionine gamma-lyase family protein [Thermoanaerobacteraceae bacterium]
MNRTAQLQTFVDNALSKVNTMEKKLRPVVRNNHRRVLAAFRQERVSDFHFHPSTGYGYGDIGREVLDNLFARVFGGEAALVRGQIVSGTHAIVLGLKSMVAGGKKLFYIGKPYDTLCSALGIEGNPSEKISGDTYPTFETEIIPLARNGRPDLELLKNKLETCGNNAVVAIQRSCGYDVTRPSYSIGYLEKLISYMKGCAPGVEVFVDNCYGEFVEDREPPMVGADLVAGSLIKNPGGAIAPGGGYLVGKKDLIDRAAAMLTAPGLGKEVGASFWDKRLVFQGLYLAPMMVLEALCGMIFAAYLLRQYGFHVVPDAEQMRTDIIQRVDLKDPDLLVRFVQGIQKFSPVDSQVIPHPALLPGYSHQVIMAAGTFVQGASLELSADAPVRPPYSVFLQGGVSREYSQEVVVSTLKMLLEENLLRAPQ